MPATIQREWALWLCFKSIPFLFLIYEDSFSALSVSYANVGERSWGQHELVQSSEEGSHEGVGLGDVDLSGVVNVEFSPGSWEELSHVGLHLSLRHLLGDEEDLSSGLLASILVEDLGSGWLSSSVSGLDGVVVEDVVHDVVLVGSVVSRGWGISGSWSWLLWSLKGNSSGLLGGEESDNNEEAGGIFHVCFYVVLEKWSPLILAVAGPAMGLIVFVFLRR